MNSKQLEAFEIVKNYGNLFLTGSAGTGKSFTVKSIIDYFKSIDNSIYYLIISNSEFRLVSKLRKVSYCIKIFDVSKVNPENTLFKFSIIKL